MRAVQMTDDERKKMRIMRIMKVLWRISMHILFIVVVVGTEAIHLVTIFASCLHAGPGVVRGREDAQSRQSREREVRPVGDAEVGVVRRSTDRFSRACASIPHPLQIRRF